MLSAGLIDPTHAGAQAPPDPAAAAELEQLAAAYGLVADPRTRFSHLFLNVVEHPGQRVRPPSVDALQWRQALHAAGGENNPQHLWPVLAVGFKDLVARKQAQVCCLITCVCGLDTCIWGSTACVDLAAWLCGYLGVPVPGTDSRAGASAGEHCSCRLCGGQALYAAWLYRIYQQSCASCISV